MRRESRPLRLMSFILVLSVNLVTNLAQSEPIKTFEFFDLQDNEIVLQREIHRPVLPASTLKVLTLYWALRQLGPYHKFKLRLYLKGDTAYIVTEGPWLIEENVGDPLKVLTELFRRIPHSEAKLIKRVAIVNGGYLDNWHTLWSNDYYGEEFAPPITRFAFNENMFRINLKANGQVEEVYPSGLKFKLRNNVRVGITGPSPYGYVVYENDTRIIEVFGALKSGKGDIAWAVDIKYNYFNAEVVRIATHKAGLRIRDVLFVKGLPPGAELSVTSSSPPLMRLLKHCAYWSDNFVAEGMLRYMVFLKYRKVSTELEREYLKEIIHELSGEGVDIRGVRIVDGCGLSRYNRVTASFMVSLLRNIYLSPVFAHVLELLPGPGSGTLHSRHTLSNLKLRAKTGTLRDVSALVGYIQTGGKWYAFFMAENYILPDSAKMEEDQLLQKFRNFIESSH